VVLVTVRNVCPSGEDNGGLSDETLGGESRPKTSTMYRTLEPALESHQSRNLSLVNRGKSERNSEQSVFSGVMTEYVPL
jgi:hypothetical protein